MQSHWAACQALLPTCELGAKGTYLPRIDSSQLGVIESFLALHHHIPTVSDHHKYSILFCYEPFLGLSIVKSAPIVIFRFVT